MGHRPRRGHGDGRVAANRRAVVPWSTIARALRRLGAPEAPLPVEAVRELLRRVAAEQASGQLARARDRVAPAPDAGCTP